TVGLDGHHTRQLFSNPSGAELPHWSPDGTQVSIFCCDDGMAAHIVTRDTGAFRELAPTDPNLEVHCGWWSPDGVRLACESFGLRVAAGRLTRPHAAVSPRAGRRPARSSPSLASTHGPVKLTSTRVTPTATTSPRSHTAAWVMATQIGVHPPNQKRPLMPLS